MSANVAADPSAAPWVCPVCAAPLRLEDGSYRCAAGHSFDRAREGYVNLLLSQHKKSRQPGDDKAMLAARRSFLEAGHYAAFSRAVTALLATASGGDASPAVLDVGCGEGYYLRRLAADWPHATAPRLAGLDIARPAVRLAAKAQPAAHWAVASSYRIPLADAAMDALLRLFAPADVAECRRVLRPGGYLLTAVPGPQHLLGLKQALYAEPQLHDAQEPLPEGFVLEAHQRLTGSLRLDTPQTIADLLRMTPFYWNVDQATQTRVLALPQLETPIEFALSLYRRLA